MSNDLSKNQSAGADQLAELLKESKFSQAYERIASDMYQADVKNSRSDINKSISFFKAVESRTAASTGYQLHVMHLDNGESEIDLTYRDKGWLGAILPAHKSVISSTTGVPNGEGYWMDPGYLTSNSPDGDRLVNVASGALIDVIKNDAVLHKGQFVEQQPDSVAAKH